MTAFPLRISAARKFLLGINILSLDAPLVALVWQDFFAANLGVKLSAAPRLVLALTIWLAYAADRWLDGWKIPPGVAMTARHRFAQCYRTPLALIWVAVLCGTVALAWFRLPVHLFERGLKLVLFVAIYFFLNQWPGMNRWLRGLKEMIVGILFAAGTVVFILPQRIPATLAVWWPMAAWSSLCFLNCYAIACWELEMDRAEKQESLVTRWPLLPRCFRGSAIALAVFALAPMLTNNSLMPPRIGLAVAASSLFLGTLDYWSGSVEADFLRIAADIVLLTPLLFKLFH